MALTMGMDVEVLRRKKAMGTITPAEEFELERMERGGGVDLPFLPKITSGAFPPPGMSGNIGAQGPVIAPVGRKPTLEELEVQRNMGDSSKASVGADGKVRWWEALAPVLGTIVGGALGGKMGAAGGFAAGAGFGSSAIRERERLGLQQEKRDYLAKTEADAERENTFGQYEAAVTGLEEGDVRRQERMARIRAGQDALTKEAQAEEDAIIASLVAVKSYDEVADYYESKGKPKLAKGYRSAAKRQKEASAEPVATGEITPEDFRDQFKAFTGLIRTEAPFLDDATTSEFNFTNLTAAHKSWVAAKEMGKDTGLIEVTLVNSFQRMIDPATVREGDVALQRSSQSLLAQLEIRIASIAKGQIINDDLASQMMSTATAMLTDIHKKAMSQVDALLTASERGFHPQVLGAARDFYRTRTGGNIVDEESQIGTLEQEIAELEALLASGAQAPQPPQVPTPQVPTPQGPVSTRGFTGPESMAGMRKPLTPEEMQQQMAMVGRPIR